MTALPLGLALALSLGACTAPSETEPAPSAAQEVVVAGDADPMYRALTAVYAQQLEHAGFRVTVLDPAADPAAQVKDGTADVAITAARAMLTEQATATGADADDAALTRGEVTRLVNAAKDDSFSSIELSPGDLGRVLVMSRAEMTLHEIDDFTDVARQCRDLRFTAERAAAARLEQALADAGCKVDQVENAQAEDLAAVLRNAEADAVVMSRARAMIADEGFVQVPNTAELFDSQPVLAFAAADLDAQAETVIGQVTSKLNEQTLLSVNRMLQGPEASTPEQVARHWQWLSQ